MFLLKRWTVFMSTLSILDERNPSEYVNTVEKYTQSTLSIQVHLVFEMFLLKRWTAFMSTLSILDERNPSEYVNTVDTGSSGIRNVSTQKMNCLHVDTIKSRMDLKQRTVYTVYTGWKESIEYVNTVDTGSSGIRNVSTQKMNCLHVDTVDTNREWIRSKYTSFIQYSKCTIEDREHVDTVDTRLFE